MEKNHKQITVRMTSAQRALIMEVAEKHELSESDIIRQAVRLGLKRVDQALSAEQQQGREKRECARD
jgi:hypothetical protein